MSLPFPRHLGHEEAGLETRLSPESIIPAHFYGPARCHQPTHCPVTSETCSSLHFPQVTAANLAYHPQGGRKECGLAQVRMPYDPLGDVGLAFPTGSEISLHSLPTPFAHTQPVISTLFTPGGDLSLLLPEETGSFYLNQNCPGSLRSICQMLVSLPQTKDLPWAEESFNNLPG